MLSLIEGSTIFLPNYKLTDELNKYSLLKKKYLEDDELKLYLPDLNILEIELLYKT